VAKWRVRGVGNADFYRMDKQKPQWVPSGAEPECTTTTTSSTQEQWVCRATSLAKQRLPSFMLIYVLLKAARALNSS